MSPSTVLLRQIHPNFYPNSVLSSQAFYPFPKDKGDLSVYDGDQISAKDSHKHYTEVLELQSVCVYQVSCEEVTSLALQVRQDPLQDFPEHAVIGFANLSDKDCRKLAKKLRDFALAHGCLFAA